MFHGWNTSPVSSLILPSRGHVKEPVTAPYVTASPGYICSTQSVNSHHALRVLIASQFCSQVLSPPSLSKMSLEKDSKYF